MLCRFLWDRLQVLLLLQVGLEVVLVFPEEVKHFVLLPAHSISVVCAFFVSRNLALLILFALMGEKWLYVFVLFFTQASCNEACVIFTLSCDGCRRLVLGHWGLCLPAYSTSISDHVTLQRFLRALVHVGKLILELL